jgi:hypothetical protein
MKGIGWIIGGVLLLTGKKSAPAQTGSQLGQYATPALPRAGSTASRSQPSKSSSSSGGGGAAPGTQAAGKQFWNALENLFSAPSQNVIPRVDDSPDPGVPDFWATPGTPQGGTTDVLGSLFPQTDDGSDVPQFGGDPSLQFDDNGLLIDPNTGVPFGQTSTDVTTPGGFFPDQFGPDAPPDDGSFDDFSL